MNFSSINIQGNIVSSEILDKIRTEEKFKYQSPEAFGLSRTASLRDEIGMAWSIMRAHWQAYKIRLENLPKGDTGTSLTREKLIIPLLAELGYEVSIQKAQQINGKSYAISHGATNRDLFPIHIMGYNDHLDKRREHSGPRLSPHALVQEFLNNTEHLFALVTNGKQLRLLRDATRLVRMSYLEFDLERMFEEELYADFSLLYRTLHVTRMPEAIESGADAIIEYYHLESLASGTRIREKLSEAVENSIKTLANGFLSHKNNTDLIDLIEGNRLDADTFYTYQLRLIYRILFLIVLEERKLIFPDNPSEEEQRFHEIYHRFYSIERLRKLTENRVYVDADKYDLWESLKTTFLLFEEEYYGSKLGIKPLGSGLFAVNALGGLKEQRLSNGNLIDVLKRLTTFVSDQGQLVRVNYSDLDVEEFGSIYEGLLEYDPKISKVGARYEFSFVFGDGRSSSGSHYTPEELVKPLIKHSLDYIITDKLKEEDPEAALLSITVCDVACGSGHILLSAARKIATELASFRESAEQPSPTYYRTAIRDVIRNCIYGVDLNPLAVELCKVALWLEAHNPNEPLNFLDHHIKCGNAIVGLAHFNELQNGIATEAFKTLPNDEKEIAATFRKRNTEERKKSWTIIH
ncbi:N-6 DNA methylase [Leeuwenhoekiella aequorea]|uniref:Eco57I restriction-modification methylase domain-containing protein n=1 Tax=Leeuwenhoekiella aequorea TaxID=283736 RepID=UPI00352EE89F|tara:strand:- start:31612 stop:33513 length:1902 start_codon:yes stop_codon:yes gene_type:complete